RMTARHINNVLLTLLINIAILEITLAVTFTYYHIKHGKLLQMNTTEHFNENSIVGCARRCQAANCSAINFNTMSRMCEVKLDDVTINRTKVDETDVNWMNAVHDEACPSASYRRDIVNGRCYKFVDEKVNWATAKQKCEDDGGDLCAVETYGEWEALSKAMFGYEGGPWYTLGQNTTDGWRWLVPGTPKILMDRTMWGNGKPDNAEVDQICIALADHSYRLNNIRCTFKRKYICESPAYFY
ncbi:unnamed protein product, partial [Owenia fusiformis]